MHHPRGVVKSGVSRKSSISRDVTELDKTRQESVAMKAKIRSLELEVDTLKQRLDSLRKAKNTTIVKREREEILIQAGPRPQHRSLSLTTDNVYHSRPGSGRYPANHYQSSSHILPDINTSRHHEEELRALTESHNHQLKEKDSEIEQIKVTLATSEKSFEDRLLKMATDHQKIVKELEERLTEKDKELEEERGHSQHMMTLEFSKQMFEAELEKLRKENKSLEKQVDELISANVKLKDTNLVLQGKCETLLEDLSVKEAQWSEKEDMLHAEIRKQWGDRYHQWIAKAEKKMEELQQINVMLQSMMKTKAQNPGL